MAKVEKNRRLGNMTAGVEKRIPAMKAVQAEGAQQAGQAPAGNGEAGERAGGCREADCGGLAHQATISPWEPRTSHASQHILLPFLIHTPQPSALRGQGCACGGRQRGEVRLEERE